MAERLFSVAGMSCGHCKAAVTQALQDLDGVETATVDLAAKTVAVKYDPQVVGAEQLQAAIEEAGYEVVA